MAEQEKGGTNSYRWYPVWVAIVGFLLYANTIGNGYALDDGAVIGANPYVQQGLRGISGVFTTDTWHFENADLGYYRPLSLVTFAIENQFFHNNPAISHLINALLYALTGFILCLLLLRIFSNYNPLFAFISALLFIAHPIHTEAVANIKSRDEILSFLNLLLATWFLLRAADDGKINWKSWFLSCIFFYLALLSKESAITGLFFIPVVLYFTNSFNATQIIKYTAPFLVLTVVFQLQKYVALGTLSGPDTGDIVSFPYTGTGARFATAFTHLAWYVKLIAVPYPLSYNYAYNQIPVAGWLSVGTITGVILAVLLATFSLKNLNKKSPFAFGIFVFSALLIPAIAFVILKGGILAERFLYAPALGFCIAITWLIFNATKISLDKAAIVTDKLKLLPFAGIFICYSFITIPRNADWKNDLTISSHDVKISPNSCQVHLHYGKKLIDDVVTETGLEKKQSDFKTGVAELYEAININPHYARAYFKLAYAYQAIAQNNDSAIYYYNRSIDEAPGYAPAYNNLGALYFKLGRFQLADHFLEKALQINPGLVSATQLLHQLQQAQSNNGPATSANPSDTTFESLSNLGVKCAREKNFTDAQKYFLKAIQLKPAAVEARVNLAVCYSMMQQYNKSADVLNAALKIDPNSKIALQNMAALYHITGDKAKEQQYRDRLERLK